MSIIESAREDLLAKLEPIERAFSETKAKLETIGYAKQQLEAALKALTPSRSQRGKAARGGPKPCARKSDVHDVCLDLVRDNPRIGKEDLASLAKDRLAAEMGFSLSGFGLRFAEVLSTGTFQIDEADRISIAGGGEGPTGNRVAVPA